ncbi:MAG: protein kinase [Planctomycetes bacterium]|nr:protein kinase [Planctomycetota bacterium]
MSDDPREGESFRDDHLDAGIRAAFESQGASTPRAQSVLREIGVVAGGAAERRASADRYELLGEIARGGVGMVLRGRDLDLGREVAVKVLLDRHRRRPRVVERFVEEARIASRLQHPGTVPVYDFGVLRDGRPFFTMKLVDGRTLEDLLATRANVESDRSHFLAIFEQVCHTVAYAHANGVIHRDLKPANVMIGAFGEVQVMDWGLSKALAGGDELEPGSGSVMGTPGYLSPEAARGDVASIDERSDVFGLGGILCEILTGRPPFVAESPFETIPRAAAGNVVDAIARLDACGAEPALIAIAKACLDPDPAARPRGASELAKRVAAHRAAGEERSRRLELAVAEARARASSEKRARRFAVGLAAAVLLGAAGAIWVQADRATRHRETTRDVSRAMEEAQSLRAAARESRDLATWARATAAAQRASALARPDEADRDTVDAARLLVAGVAKDESEARARVAEESADRATVEHVEEVRARAGDSLAWKKVDAEYAAAFSRYQLDPAAPDPGAAIDIDRMRASPIRADLATALDGWAAARLMAFGDKDPQSATLQRVAQAVDADPLRIRLRAAMQQRDLDELRRLAADASAGELPPATLDRLGDALEQAGDSAAALATYQAAQLLHPDDFWLNFQLARLLAGSNPPRKDEAVRFNQAAIAVRPRSAPAWTNLAANFIGTGRYDEAEPSLRRALSLDPDLATAHSNLSALLRAKGKLDDAESEAKEAIRLAPGVAISHSNLAAVLLDRGNVDGALAELEEARRLDPKDEIVRFNLGFLLQRKGRTARKPRRRRSRVSRGGASRAELHGREQRPRRAPLREGRRCGCSRCVPRDRSLGARERDVSRQPRDVPLDHEGRVRSQRGRSRSSRAARNRDRFTRPESVDEPRPRVLSRRRFRGMRDGTRQVVRALEGRACSRLVLRGDGERATRRARSRARVVRQGGRVAKQNGEAGCTAAPRGIRGARSARSALTRPSTRPLARRFLRWSDRL